MENCKTEKHVKFLEHPIVFSGNGFSIEPYPTNIDNDFHPISILKETAPVKQSLLSTIKPQLSSIFSIFMVLLMFNLLKLFEKVISGDLSPLFVRTIKGMIDTGDSPCNSSCF